MMHFYKCYYPSECNFKETYFKATNIHYVNKKERTKLCHELEKPKERPRQNIMLISLSGDKLSLVKENETN